jgi:hypothetical protein
MASSPSLSAFWIWRRQDSYTPYHQVILARKTFRLAQPRGGEAPSGNLKIAVDGAYRLFVNSEWVADGPARSWPEHFQYDEIDITPYLAAGLNEIAIVARHWQVGDFHNRPQQAGLLVQLDLIRAAAPAAKRRIISDSSWETAWLKAWAAKWSPRSCTTPAWKTAWNSPRRWSSTRPGVGHKVARWVGHGATCTAAMCPCLPAGRSFSAGS